MQIMCPITRFCIGIISFSFLVSCSLAPSSLGDDIKICDEVTGLQEVVSKERNILVFGELHGTLQSPQTFSKISCNLLNLDSMPLSVGLEFPLTVDDVLNEYMNSSSKEMDEDALIEALNDKLGSVRDGRFSFGVIDLISDLRELKRDGFDVEIFAMVDRTAESKSIGMAESIIAEISKRPEGSQIITLVGNFHSRNNPDDPMRSMTYHLPVDQTLNFNIAYESGDAFVCMREGCKIYPFTYEVDEPWEGRPEIATVSPDQYHDGYWYVGKISPSMPIFDATGKDPHPRPHH